MMDGERQVVQDVRIYEFSLERHVPANHLLRAIDRVIDLSGLGRTCGPSIAQLAGLRSIQSR